MKAIQIKEYVKVCAVFFFILWPFFFFFFFSSPFFLQARVMFFSN